MPTKRTRVAATTPKAPRATKITKKKAQATAAATVGLGSATLAHVHETREIVSLIEFTPPHAPRRETPAFEHTRRQLIDVLDKPCRVCGVRQSILGDPEKREDQTVNPKGAQFMEAHHDPIEWSMVDAVDWRKVHVDYPQVVSPETLLAFLDSAANMTILCDVDHVGPIGWHHVTYPDARIQPYLLDGYVVAGSVASATAALAHDEQIARAAGVESSDRPATEDPPTPAAAAPTTAA